MKKIKIIICSIALIVISNACQDDFLDRVPLDEVTEAAFFKTPNDLKLYMNQYYSRKVFSLLDRNKRSDLDADTNMQEDFINTRFVGSRTVANDDRNFQYKSIRSVNYFFDRYKGVDADFEEYKQFLGEAHFFRARFYFGQMRTFGDIPWFTTALETDSPELFDPRTPRNIVADNIIADLDSAALYLTEDRNDGASRINKWVALLLQSRVALYEGAWEKYHADGPFAVSGADPDKYFNKVVEATTEIMAGSGADIYSTGSPSTDYTDFFGMQDYSSISEVLFWTKMSAEFNIFAGGKLDRLSTPDGYGTTKSLADSYLCNDGLPTALSPLYQGNNSIIDESTNRDPRFYQTIFTPDVSWRINEDADTIFWKKYYEETLFNNLTNSPPTGYHRRKDYNAHDEFQSENFELTPSIQYRYAEVLLNFAEAKAELGTISQADIDMSIKKLRDRVGMPNLIIGSIATDPNWTFPTLSPLINEIRRERKIELALEGLRWDDIARWAAADELIVGKRPLGAFAAQYAIAPLYPVDDDGFLDPFQNAIPGGYGFVLGRDYLTPVSLRQIEINPNLTQNPGW